MSDDIIKFDTMDNNTVDPRKRVRVLVMASTVSFFLCLVISSFYNNNVIIAEFFNNATAPFISIIAGYLVYYSFVQQLKANEDLRNQVNEEKANNTASSKLDFVMLLINNLESRIEEFKYKESLGVEAITELYYSILDHQFSYSKESEYDYGFINQLLEMEMEMRSVEKFADYFWTIGHRIKELNDIDHERAMQGKEFFNLQLNIFYRKMFNPFTKAEQINEDLRKVSWTEKMSHADKTFHGATESFYHKYFTRLRDKMREANEALSIEFPPPTDKEISIAVDLLLQKDGMKYK